MKDDESGICTIWANGTLLASVITHSQTMQVQLLILPYSVH